jgi:hypothetical protein
MSRQSISKKLRSIQPALWGGQQDPWSHGCSLYVLQERRQGPVKVGIAEHPIRRLSALQGGNPRRISMRAIYVGSREDCRFIEGAILFRFSGRGLIGEWLDVPLAEVLSEISSFEEAIAA